jgi:hypothetical protein
MLAARNAGRSRRHMTEKQHVVEGSMENKTRFYNMYRSHRKKVVKWRFYTVEPTFQDTVF